MSPSRFPMKPITCGSVSYAQQAGLFSSPRMRSSVIVMQSLRGFAGLKTSLPGAAKSYLKISDGHLDGRVPCFPFSNLLAALADVPDPRRAQGKRYPLPHLLLFTVLALHRPQRVHRRRSLQGHSEMVIEVLPALLQKRDDAAVGLGLSKTHSGAMPKPCCRHPRPAKGR